MKHGGDVRAKFRWSFGEVLRPWLSRPRVHQGAARYAKFEEIKSAELGKIMETTYIFIFGWMIGNAVITELSNFDDRSNFWLLGGPVLVTILLKRLYPNLRERDKRSIILRLIYFNLFRRIDLVPGKALTHLMLATLQFIPLRPVRSSNSSLPRMKIASTFECKWLRGPHYRAEKCDAHRAPDV